MVRSGAGRRNRPRSALAHARLSGVTVRGYAGNPRDSRVNRPFCRSGRRLFLWQRRAKARKTAVLPEFMKHEVRHGRPLDARKLTQQADPRSEEHTSELQSLMRNSYAVFCLKKKKKKHKTKN